MEFIIAESTEDMSRQAADRIASFVTADPSCVLGLATGTTPIGLYACLVDDCAQGKLSFADVTTFNLDEYRGLAPEHDQSYRYFMKQHLFDHVDIDQARTHVPEGSNPDAEAVCAAIRATLSELFGPAVAEEMRVLYGGSMNPANVEGLMAQPNIDGGLIGGASLKADSFIQLVKACL